MADMKILRIADIVRDGSEIWWGAVPWTGPRTIPDQNNIPE